MIDKVSEPTEIFNKLLDSLRTKVSDFNYKNFFQNIRFEMDNDDRILVKVPTRFVRDWVRDHYRELIKFELFRHTEKEYDLVFKVDRHVSKKTLELFPDKRVQPTANNSNVNSLQESRIQDQNHSQNRPFTQQQAKPRKSKSKAGIYGFNPKYSFDNFVVGNSNQLVHAACRAVALQPAKSYNPLFIYGDVGLGKTHLINSIGIDILKQYPNWKIIYVTGEHFTNEVINAIRYDKTFELRKKYRNNCDILLIDDIQFIAGKERTMEEFFHTFNALYEARKQIILTSDKLPKDIPNLEERLRSRFSWGLLADIQAPDYETRIAILQHKAEKEGIELSSDVCEFIAENVTSNVRDLEGSLIRVFAFASLSKVPVTLELTREVLHNILVNSKPKLSIERIQTTVSEFYNLKISDLKSKRRHKNLAVPRQIAMYLCKKHLGSSFPEIGNKFGGKDHTTVIHAFQKITKNLDQNPTITSEVYELEKILGV